MLNLPGVLLPRISDLDCESEGPRQESDFHFTPDSSPLWESRLQSETFEELSERSASFPADLPLLDDLLQEQESSKTPGAPNQDPAFEEFEFLMPVRSSSSQLQIPSLTPIVKTSISDLVPVSRELPQTLILEK